MHSLELLLDPDSDADMRQVWQHLDDAGLPSPARHTGATNAPHITLLARPAIDSSHDDSLRRNSDDLPLPALLGGLVVFGLGARGLVLARLVVAGRPLVDLHSRVHAAAPPVPGGADVVPHTLPGAWTPHVTLASRLDIAQVGQALEVLAGLGAPRERVSLVTLRRWDSTAKTVTALGGSR